MRTWLSTILLTAVLAVLAVTAIGGWRPVVLLSDSMSPGAPAGSLLLARPVPARAVAPGDVVVAMPAGAQRLVTHRVVGFTDDGTGAWTRGDANSDVDPAPVPLVGELLVMRWALPGAGRAVMALTARNVLAVAMVGSGLAMIAWAWRSPARRATHGL